MMEIPFGVLCRFWLTLLLDALPLLGASSLIFSSEDTYELMHCMEEINIARKIEKMDAANSEVGLISVVTAA